MMALPDESGTQAGISAPTVVVFHKPSASRARPAGKHMRVSAAARALSLSIPGSHGSQPTVLDWPTSFPGIAFRGRCDLSQAVRGRRRLKRIARREITARGNYSAAAVRGPAAGQPGELVIGWAASLMIR